MINREIECFSVDHHKIIWDCISKVEELNFGDNYLNKIRDSKLKNQFFDLNLLKLITDSISISHPEIINKLSFFINPNEILLTTLSNSKRNLLGNLSLLERYKSLKRCRHLIESWSSQRLNTLENCISILIDRNSSQASDSSIEIDDLFKDLNSDALKFQNLYYLERQHISSLDKQRCGNYALNN